MTDTSGYVLLHLVAGEAMTSVISTQVVDHAESQATADGTNAPAAVIVGILEPVRRAVSRPLRKRLLEFRRRAPDVRVALLPYSGRARGQSVALLARRVARFARGRAVVFHCRGEEAVLWAADLSRHLERRRGAVGIVGDIRGAWPDEFLLIRGFDSAANATPSSLTRYDYHIGRLRQALHHAHAVLTVSRPLASWLESHGARGEVTVVPCSVSRVAFSPAERAAARARMGLADDTLLLAYVGSIAPYQHLENGALAFARQAMAYDARVRFLAITNDAQAFNALIAKAELPLDRCTVVSLPQAAVPSVLCAADAGLLLRAPSRVNEVSMPVKLGEYLSSGVPVIVSRIPGWVTEIVDDAGAGVAASWFGVKDDRRREETVRAIDQIREDADGYRARAVALCQARFLWSAYTARVRETYVASLRHTSASGRQASEGGSDQRSPSEAEPLVATPTGDAT